MKKPSSAECSGNHGIEEGILFDCEMHFYFLDFECILDKNNQPLPYSEQSALQILDKGKVHWGTSAEENIKDELPPGAQR